MYKIVILFLLTTFSMVSRAQTGQFGVLYEITELDAEEIPMLSMLKGSTIQVSYGDGISKTDINMMFGMIHLEVFSDEKNKETSMYFDMMGQKKYVKQPMGPMGIGPKEAAAAAGIDGMEMKKGKGKSRKIAGYKSSPYEIKGGPDGMGMTIYITNKLQTKQAGGMSLLKDLIKMPDINGFPMMVELSMQGMGITLEAKEVTKSIDPKSFTQPSGYEESTMEELLGGIGGGFGGMDMGMGQEEEMEEEEMDNEDEVEEHEVKEIESEVKNAPNDDINELFNVEERPEFIGGDAEMYKFLSANLKYPAEAKANKTEGTVIISFVVEKDGSLSDILAIRNLPHGCTEEAIRVVKMMPKWKPGKIQNTPVKVKYTLPVKYLLN